MGLAIGPRVGANTLVIGDAAGTVNPFNGEGIAYGYETGRLAAAALGEALAGGDAARARLYEERLDAAYGEYYKVARAFVRVISEPRILARAWASGLRVAPLMRELLEDHGQPDVQRPRGTRRGRLPGALERLADVVPERAYTMLLGRRRPSDARRARRAVALGRAHAPNRVLTVEARNPWLRGHWATSEHSVTSKWPAAITATTRCSGVVSPGTWTSGLAAARPALART